MGCRGSLESVSRAAWRAGITACSLRRGRTRLGMSLRRALSMTQWMVVLSSNALPLLLDRFRIASLIMKIASVEDVKAAMSPLLTEMDPMVTSKLCPSAMYCIEQGVPSKITPGLAEPTVLATAVNVRKLASSVSIICSEPHAVRHEKDRTLPKMNPTLTQCAPVETRRATPRGSG
jgi:hypothetical protein